jgi:hypothetical protein
MKTKKYVLGFLAAGLMLLNPCTGQTNADINLAGKAYRSLKRANIVNGISIGFGVASNIEMIAIGGFPLEIDDGLNPGLNISHAFLGIGRITTSNFPPINVSKARKILEPWRESPEMALSCRKLFSNLDAAQILTAVAPVLCVVGGAMMAYASTIREYHYKYDNHYNYDCYTTTGNPGLKTAGWVFVGAGLAASISSTILINICKRELSIKMGSLKMTAGPTSVGFQYNLPDKH